MGIWYHIGCGSKLHKAVVSISAYIFGSALITGEMKTIDILFITSTFILEMRGEEEGTPGDIKVLL